MKSLLLIISALLLSAALMGSGATAFAEKKQPKPKPKPVDYLIVKLETVIVTSRQADGSGQDYAISGDLHVTSQVLVDADGSVVEFRLHANFMSAFGIAEDGERRPANGSVKSVFQPVQPCTLGGSCGPVVWILTFPDVVKIPGPAGVPIPYPNLVFDLQLETTYDEDGRLVSATVVTDGID